ncbi:hypothetical protein MCOR25_009518 [Pyricularia grisea]|nr:hypothetical protein MCOR25_009518 [Pyricularia grisea]
MKFSVTLATLAAIVSMVVAAPARTLEARQYGGNTYNQLTDGTPCRDITVIYARGTTQDGNVGDPAAVGPLIFNALAGIVGTDRLAVQGVTYAANILGFLLGGDPNGVKVMKNLTETVCPSTTNATRKGEGEEEWMELVRLPNAQREEKETCWMPSNL